MRYFVLFFVATFLYAQTDCNKIFETRKGEIIYEIEKLENLKDEIKALEEAKARVFGEKEASFEKKEQNIQSKVDEIRSERERIEKLVAKNQEILDEMTKSKDEKLIELYTNMKPSAAGEVMNSMEPLLASKILSQLESKVSAAIIARIEPATAAKITEILYKGAEFLDLNQTK